MDDEYEVDDELQADHRHEVSRDCHPPPAGRGSPTTLNSFIFPLLLSFQLTLYLLFHKNIVEILF